MSDNTAPLKNNPERFLSPDSASPEEPSPGISTPEKQRVAEEVQRQHAENEAAKNVDQGKDSFDGRDFTNDPVAAPLNRPSEINPPTGINSIDSRLERFLSGIPKDFSPAQKVGLFIGGDVEVNEGNADDLTEVIPNWQEEARKAGIDSSDLKI